MTERLAGVTGAARGRRAAGGGEAGVDGWSLLLVDACAPQRPADYPMPAPEDLAAVARGCRTAGAARVGELIADVGDGAVRDKLRNVLAGGVPAELWSAARAS